MSNPNKLRDWEAKLSGETNVMWKVINKHLTPETQQYIHLFIAETLRQREEELAGRIEKLETLEMIGDNLDTKEFNGRYISKEKVLSLLAPIKE